MCLDSVEGKVGWVTDVVFIMPVYPVLVTCPRVSIFNCISEDRAVGCLLHSLYPAPCTVQNKVALNDEVGEGGLQEQSS